MSGLRGFVVEYRKPNKTKSNRNSFAGSVDLSDSQSLWYDSDE